jgi:hypothetical protein
MGLRLASFLFLLLASLPAEAAYHRKIVVSLRNQFYRFHFLSNEGDPTYADPLLTEGQDWYIGRLIEKGVLDPARTPEMLEQLRTTESVFQPGSALIVVEQIEPRGFGSFGYAQGKIVGTMGFSKPPLGELTVMEKRLLGRGLEQPFARNFRRGRAFRPILQKPGHDYNLEIGQELVSGAVGGVFELKKLALAEGAEKSLVPLMFLVSEALGVSSHADGGSLMPDEYVGETDIRAIAEQMRDDWGFSVREIDNPHIPGNKTYVMRISRADWVKRTLTEMSRRLGANGADADLRFHYNLNDPEAEAQSEARRAAPSSPSKRQPQLLRRKLVHLPRGAI